MRLALILLSTWLGWTWVAPPGAFGQEDLAVEAAAIAAAYRRLVSEGEALPGPIIVTGTRIMTRKGTRPPHPDAELSPSARSYFRARGWSVVPAGRPADCEAGDRRGCRPTEVGVEFSLGEKSVQGDHAELILMAGYWVPSLPRDPIQASILRVRLRRTGGVWTVSSIETVAIT